MTTTGNVAPAIDLWNDLVAESGGVEDAVSDLLAGKLKPGFYIPGFARLVVLRPYFMSPPLVDYVRASSEAVLSAHRKVLEAVLGSDGLKQRHFSSFFDWTERVLRLDRPGPVHAACLRFDSSIVDGQPRFIELNTDMPQAAGLGDSFSRFLSGLPVMGEFGKKYRVEPQLIQERFLRAMQAEWKASGGKGTPNVCFVTWRDEPVRLTDMNIDREYFASHGYEASVCDPRDLEYDGKSLTADGKKIDLVYRVISTAEALERAEDMKTLIEAEKEGSVLMVNSFRSELMGNKAMFALLHDRGFRGEFTPAEKDAIDRCVPWTRILREGRCEDYAGEEVDLVEWTRENREELVLKPTHDFGGHDVTIGSSVTGDEWEAALEEALQHDFIVQRKIGMSKGAYPIAEEGIPILELYEDVDPFMLGYSYAGCISRMSDNELTNVHLHGAIGAVFELTAL